jgi:hypothetical protein
MRELRYVNEYQPGYQQSMISNRVGINRISDGCSSEILW